MQGIIDFSPFQWSIALVCAVMIGFTKTGIPGTGTLVVPLMATIIPAKESTGFVLPMLSMADILAIIYWRRHVEWQQLARLLPWTWLGIVLGYLCMGHICNDDLKIFIGVLILALMGVSWLRDQKIPDDRVPNHWLFAAFMGVLAGFTSMMANAAGAVMIIYLMAMGLRKEAFVGTRAWFFWIVNLSKLPFSHRLDLITAQSLKTNITLLPCIVIGGILGVIAVHRIPQKAFNIVVKILAAGAAVYLCVPI
jgi:uncharacterized membrane protein YfcA